MFDLAQAVQDANKAVGCQLCRGIRFKRCGSCGQEVNSFPDHRVGQLKPQMYPAFSDWYREGERRPEPAMPERRLQP